VTVLRPGGHDGDMVGLLLVSHSATLATGLVDLLRPLTSGKVPLVVAAGTEDGELGTSADLVASGLAEADAGQGVVVLPDLGSAVMSVRVALEDADSDRVVLVDAPFVEGAVSAAVTAAGGADLRSVVAAAEQARTVAKL